jgi:hypothetical protein
MGRLVLLRAEHREQISEHIYENSNKYQGALTTRLALFGPVFVVAIFHLPVPCVFRRVEAIKHCLVSKYTNKM